jgi:hypothetical protein
VELVGLDILLLLNRQAMEVMVVIQCSLRLPLLEEEAVVVII